MIRLNDQMGRVVQLPAFPKRIISIVPSQTEYLYDLGLELEVIGITKFCIHPKPWFENKVRVGGTKNLAIEKIRSLEPDLIIGNLEENTKSEIELLEKEFPIYMSDILSIDDAYTMMLDIGKLTNKESESENLVSAIQDDFKTFPRISGKIAYFMWKNPFMIAGKSTFIGHVIEKLGMSNVFDDPNGRYVEIEANEIKKGKADFCLLSSEPFPFKKEDVDYFKNELGKKAFLVDGEMFSWYGSRMKRMKAYFEKLSEEIKED